MPTVDTPRITATGTYPRITVNVVTGATGPGGGAVDSVNGQTGVVVLDAADVGALPDDTVIPDVSGLVASSDPRLSDARTPTAHNHAGSDITSGTIAQARLGTGSAGAGAKFLADDQTYRALPVSFVVALSDETTALTTGQKAVFRAPHAFTLTGVRASLTTASSSGLPTIDIKEGGTTILSTKITVDASELTSTTAATPAAISDSSIADDAALSFHLDVAGTGAAGLKVTLIGVRV